MRVRSVIALMVVLLLGSVAFAQDYSKTEVGLNYSYTRFNPQNNGITGGAFSLNGGGGSLTYFFLKHIGIKGEFEGTTSQTRTFTVPPAFCSTAGGGVCTFPVQANLFTYNALVVAKGRFEKFEPYIETGLGGAHSNAYINSGKACTGCIPQVGAPKPSNNAFDFVIGGGLDIPVTPHFAILVGEFDYLLTRFGNGLTKGNNNQSNFRYQAGAIFRF